MPLLDTSLFGIISAARKAGLPLLQTKEAFTPSPAIAQAVMQQAQGGGGGDPSQGGAGGGDPAAAGGMPPGMDPAAMNAAMQGQPAPGPGGGAPPAPSGPAGDPSPGGSSDPALSAKLDQLMQMIQQGGQGGGAGGVGPNGKPNTASVKFEPQHFHTIVNKISNMEKVLTQMADSMGLQMPASELIQQPSLGGAPLPGADGQPAAGGAPAGGQDPNAPPPSNVAQQLPALPPAAGKAASADDIHRLANGWRVAQDRGRKPGPVAAIAKLAAGRFGKKGRA